MDQATRRHHQRAHQNCRSPVRSKGQMTNDRLAMTTVWTYQSRFANGAHR